MTASTALRFSKAWKPADRMLIRAEVPLSEPLERSGHTLNQTYGLSRVCYSPTQFALGFDRGDMAQMTNSGGVASSVALIGGAQVGESHGPLLLRHSR